MCVQSPLPSEARRTHPIILALAMEASMEAPFLSFLNSFLYLFQEGAKEAVMGAGGGVEQAGLQAACFSQPISMPLGDHRV